MRCARLVFLAALAPACMLDGSCPAKSTPLATFTVSYSPLDAGDTCVVTRGADGGPTDAGLVTAPSTTSLAICGAQSDAGTWLTLLFHGQAARTVSLDGGAFAASAGASGASGSNCRCALNIAEALSGQLSIADGGVFGPDGDGGFTPVSGFSGRLDEWFSATEGGSDCACNLPCGVHYKLYTR
jgi:hypothetical protein